MTKEEQPKDVSVINSILKVQCSQTLSLLFLLKGSSWKKMPICSVLKLFVNVPLYNQLVEGQMEKLHISVQLHNTAPVLSKDSLKSCIEQILSK